MHWEELTGDEFPQAVEKVQGVCLLPLSCLERHAHHLPLGTDYFIGHELCQQAAALEPALVFPDLIFTQILEARHCPGTIALDPDLILRLLDNVCREIARNGLKKIVLVSTHGGNGHFAGYFAQSQLNQERDYAVYVANPPLLPEYKDEVVAQWETAVDGHAGESETSLMLAIRPDLVQMEQAKDDGEGMPLDRLKALRELGIYTGIWWYGDHPTHYRGDGRMGTADKGKTYLTARARTLAAAIRLIKQDSETQRLQTEFYAAAAQRPSS
jgi:creatinine amidohydrolase